TPRCLRATRPSKPSASTACRPCRPPSHWKRPRTLSCGCSNATSWTRSASTPVLRSATRAQVSKRCATGKTTFRGTDDGSSETQGRFQHAVAPGLERADARPGGPGPKPRGGRYGPARSAFGGHAPGGVGRPRDERSEQTLLTEKNPSK